MIDFHTFNRIKDLDDNEKLSAAQIAQELNLDVKTVVKWMAKDRYEQPQKSRRKSKLDPFKPMIRECLNRHHYSAAQLFQKFKAEGYSGKYTILTDYVRSVRPSQKPAFLDLSFAPGECAQVDFGYCGTVQVGNTRRRLYVFVMVLCYSRMIYLEFILKQGLEHFLSCHCHAFEFFAGIPEKVMVDNCKVAILKHPNYGDVVPHPRYADMAHHCGFI